MSGLVFAELITIIENSCFASLAEKTRDSYLYLDGWLCYAVSLAGLAEKSLDEYTYVDMNHIREVIDTPTTFPKMGGTTRLKLIKRLKQLCGISVDDDLIPRDPTRRLKVKRVDSVFTPNFQPGEFERLMAKQSDGPLEIRNLAIMSVMADTGVRSHIPPNLFLSDYHDHTILVRHDKRADWYSVGFGDTTDLLLQQYIKIRPKSTDDHLFLSNKSKKIGSRCIAEFLEDRAEPLGIQAHPHMFRVYFATRTAKRLMSEGCFDVVGELAKLLHTTDREMAVRYVRLASEINTVKSNRAGSIVDAVIATQPDRTLNAYKNPDLATESIPEANGSRALPPTGNELLAKSEAILPNVSSYVAPKIILPQTPVSQTVSNIDPGPCSQSSAQSVFLSILDILSKKPGLATMFAAMTTGFTSVNLGGSLRADQYLVILQSLKAIQ